VLPIWVRFVTLGSFFAHLTGHFSSARHTFSRDAYAPEYRLI
jgi:hypothetical protein